MSNPLARTSPEFIVFVALAIFGLSCLAPAVQWEIGIVPDPVDPHIVDNYGYSLLAASGAVGLSFLPVGLAWLANPAFMVACISLLTRNFKAAYRFGLAAVLLGSTFTVSSRYFPLIAEGPNGSEHWIFHRALFGFWLWLIAPALVAVFAFLIRNNSDALLGRRPRTSARF
jgi:hypothetical protein